MKRRIYNQLLEWKQVSNGRSAAVIEGARAIDTRYCPIGYGCVRQGWYPILSALYGILFVIFSDGNGEKMIKTVQKFA